MYNNLKRYKILQIFIKNNNDCDYPYILILLDNFRKQYNKFIFNIKFNHIKPLWYLTLIAIYKLKYLFITSNFPFNVRSVNDKKKTLDKLL